MTERTNRRAELLLEAARCYRSAGWTRDACRVFVDLGRDVDAARLQEQLGCWGDAARSYSRATSWNEAARCFLRAGEPVEAAECYLRAGDDLQAAWTLADVARRFDRARAVARRIREEPWDGKDVSPNLARDLVVARCDAGSGASAPAARVLLRATDQLRVAGYRTDRTRLQDWALSVADALRRPDLAALLHAAAYEAGIPGATRRWEEWALQTLGDASGIPLDEDRPRTAPIEPAGESPPDDGEGDR